RTPGAGVPRSQREQFLGGGDRKLPALEFQMTHQTPSPRLRAERLGARLRRCRVLERKQFAGIDRLGPESYLRKAGPLARGSRDLEDVVLRCRNVVSGFEERGNKSHPPEVGEMELHGELAAARALNERHDELE